MLAVVVAVVLKGVVAGVGAADGDAADGDGLAGADVLVGKTRSVGQQVARGIGRPPASPSRSSVRHTALTPVAVTCSNRLLTVSVWLVLLKVLNGVPAYA